MAGERLAKLTIECSLSDNNFNGGAQLRADQTYKQGYRLAGAWFYYLRGGSTSQHQYVVPSPADVGRDYVKQAVDNMLSLMKLDIQSGALPYTVSASRDLGNQSGTNWPRIQFDIEATQYSNSLNLDFQDLNNVLPKGWTVLANLPTLQPITVTQLVQAAGIYGSATGSIFLSATSGNRTPFVFVWNDGVTGDTRQNLTAGTYTCVVRDQDGVSTTVTCVVKSDTQLSVVVQQTETTIDLVISGGVGPYTVLWDDGATGPSRTGLATGTYSATVTDAHGATQRVVVVVRPNRCYFSQNPVLLQLDAGAAYRLDPTTKPNLSFLAEVWVEPVYRSGVYVQVGPQLEQPTDLNGYTTFNVQALLDTYVSEHVPPAVGNAVDRVDQVFKRFYLKSAEKYGTPPVPAALSTAQVHVVLCGGLSPDEAAAGQWPAYQAAVRPFLTWEPDYQRVLPAQPAYLYYQHIDAGQEVQVWLRVRHVDGTTSVSQQPPFTAGRWEVHCLRVGPDFLGLTGVDVAGYDVWVCDLGGTPLTLVRHFVLERAYYPQQRFFVYSNSLGGANVLAALGAAKQTLEVKALEAERPTYDADLGDVATLDRTGTPTVSVVTGPRRRAQVQADQELLLSRRVNLLRGDRYFVGRVKADTYTVKDESDGLASLSFDFILPKEGHFSPRLPLMKGLPAGQSVPPVSGGEGATP